MNSFTKKIAAIAVVGAVAMGSFGAAQSASADPIAGSPTITITPTTGSVDDSPMLQSIQATVGCPVGYRDAGGTLAFQNGLRMGSIADARTASTPATDGPNGLDGNPINLNRDINPWNAHVTNKALADITTPLAVGDWEIRMYCIASFQQFSVVTDKWIALPMTLDAAGTWAVKSAVVPVPATATATSLTAALSTKKATLTATIKDTAATPATITAAVGSVEFFEGTTPVGTGAVTNGVATDTTADLGTGSHSFTAHFTATDPATYATSTSAPASVTVAPEAAAPGSTNVDVTIPTGTGALSFSGLQGTISLGQAVLAGGLFTASGDLGPVTITDTRQLGAADWSLTGVTTDFTDGAKTLDGKYLGWKPALVGTTNAGVAGTEVLAAPASTDGLTAATALSTGSVVDGVTSTVVGAKLNLAAPSNTRGGFYVATLTLTLL